MKKSVCTILLLLAFAAYSYAIIAPRKPFRYTQPDGSTIELTQHGDEFHHWTTSGNTVVVKGVDGFWRPATAAQAEAAKTMSASAMNRRDAARAMRANAQESSISMGEKHFLVILIEFADLKFTVSEPNTAFYYLLNQENYSAHGATGSVRDFYIDNSTGQFQPTFDVYGPVTLSNGYAYYGRDENDSDALPDYALFEACQKLDDQVDFSKYDHDHDRFVDNIFYYYAGHNQAEGAGEDTIWPHAWALYRYNAYFDGVRVWSYACASEYKGNSGKSMCGIGTFTHEFGHVLGLPDFYDTDYEAHGTATTLGPFSTMDEGAYSNNGRTPPYFNCVERSMLGWMDWPKNIQGSQDITLPCITENAAYLTKTSVDGEEFIYEMRNGQGWDAPLPAGMLVYHIDRSNRIVGDTRAKTNWDTGYNINIYRNHPCFYIVPASGHLTPLESAVYPGTKKVTEFEPHEWDDVESIYKLEDIRHDGQTAYFHVSLSPARTLAGRVRGTDGIPLGGITVAARHAGTFEQWVSTTTGFTGDYRLNLSAEEGGVFSLVVFGKGREPISETLDISFFPYTEHDFTIAPSSDPASGLAVMGFNSISASTEWKAGDTFEFKLREAVTNSPRSVKWYFDGKQVSGGPVTLTAGSHTVRAILDYGTGTEELTLEINAE